TRRVRVTNVGPISSLRTRRAATVQSRDSTGFRRLATDASREGSRPMLRWLLQRQIAEGMDVSRPAVSQHLKVLKAAGLIVVRAEGTRRMYAVDSRGLEALRGWLDGFWNEALVAFKKAAEKAVKHERKP